MNEFMRWLRESGTPIIVWGMILGSSLILVSTISSCVIQQDEMYLQQINQLISQGEDPIIARCAVYSSSSERSSGLNCALAIQARSMGKAPVKQGTDHE